jgi:hypothetical protein
MDGLLFVRALLRLNLAVIKPSISELSRGGLLLSRKWDMLPRSGLFKPNQQ